MITTRFIKGFVVSFVFFVVLDAVWHGGILADFYGQRLALINPESGGVVPGFPPFIILLDALNAIALPYFLFRGQPSKNVFQDALWVGGLLGLVVTGSVNFLNHTLVPAWDLQMALVDTAWGTVIGMITAVAVAAVCAEAKGRGLFGWLRR